MRAVQARGGRQAVGEIGDQETQQNKLIRHRIHPGAYALMCAHLAASKIQQSKAFKQWSTFVRQEPRHTANNHTELHAILFSIPSRWPVQITRTHPAAVSRRPGYASASARP